MSNPLNKRFARELRSNFGKYAGMFLMMVFATAFTSGFLLAAGSIEKICNEMDATYAVEDGRFSCDFEPSDKALDAVEDLGVTLTPDFYCEVPLELEDSADEGITVRVYGPRTSVNLPAYAQGRAPKRADEIALDRVFAVENHGIGLGDTVRLSGRSYTVCGILTYPDYQALFADNSSFMFDALTFAVAAMSQEGYRTLDAGSEVYNYSFAFDDQTLDKAARTRVEENMLDALSDHDATVSDFVDADDNQGIGYALSDAQGDQTMWTVLLMILIVIMAFVFVVLIGATIESESSVIGTMLASGWRKAEIVRHYMFLPTLVGALGSSIGLVLGVFALTGPMKDLYYHSYSLPPYHTIWDWRVVVITAVVPFVLLVGITFLGLVRKMRFTPLQFLRHEVSSRKRNASVTLPDALSYASRFRLRVLLRNAGHFVTLTFGIMFASLLLLFGSCMLPVVKNYAGELVKTVAAPHEYVLKTPVELEGTDEQREQYAAVLRLVENRERYDANRASIEAAQRLQDDASLSGALERLQKDDELMDALDRLQDDEPLMDAARRLARKRDLVDAAQRMATGTASPKDLARLATLTSKERADLQLLTDANEQTRADIKLLTDLDDATRADVDLLRNLDDATKADVDLVRSMDESLLDDVRAASKIDEDAHVVNTQTNSPDAIAQAEKYAIGGVEIERLLGGKMESVTIYGISPHSAYWTEVPVANGAAVAGGGLIQKTKAEVGQDVEAHNRREGETYSIAIASATSNEADTNLYLTLADFNKLFGNDADYFNAYASATELAIDGRYVAQHIQPNDMLKISDQMESSMGKIMYMMMAMAVPVYLILLYLLTKTVIDRSARSISYMKVFGYHSKEVNALYVRPITYWVLFSLVISLPVIIWTLTMLLKIVFMNYAGNFAIIIPPERLVMLVAVGMAVYAAVAFLHVRRIKSVPLELAMKVQE